jgi:hypothetical protein
VTEGERETPKGTEDGATGSRLNGDQEVPSYALFYKCSFTGDAGVCILWEAPCISWKAWCLIVKS